MFKLLDRLFDRFPTMPLIVVGLIICLGLAGLIFPCLKDHCWRQWTPWHQHDFDRK